MINMEFCWIRGCKNYMCYNPSVDLYPLPVDLRERALWISAFGLKGQANSATRVCGSHFRHKYFLKTDGNTNVNTADGTLLVNGVKTIPGSVNSQLRHNFYFQNATNPHASANNGLITVAINNDQETTTILGPQVKSIASIISPSNLSQEILVESEKIINSNFVSVEESSNAYCPEASQPLTNDSCELSLYCSEESLTPEQQKFHADEWMNYVKFTTSIHNLPYVTAAKGSDIGEQSPRDVASPDLPVLVYSNSVPPPQSLVHPVPNSVASNTPVLLQISPTISAPLNVANPTVTQCNIPSVVSKEPSIFPIRLEKTVEKIKDKSTSVQTVEEEILPVVVLYEQEDSSDASLLNKVNDTSTTVCSLSQSNKTDKSSDEIFKKSTQSPLSPSQNSDTDSCVSPELFCSVEVNFEENETDSISFDENTSTSLCSDVASDSSNGPKIIDIVSGDAGANEFFKDNVFSTTVENDSQLAEDSDNSSDRNAIFSSDSSLPLSKFSIFSMQKTIAVIASGKVDANIHNLLGVRPHIPPITLDRYFASALKNQLRKEEFMTMSPWWMIQKRFLPLNPPCIACGSKAFRVNSCYEYLDGLCWTCENATCRKIYPVKRPKFFDRFPSFSLEELLLLTYHWACKSRIGVIVKDVPVHEERIWGYFTALQEICGNFVNRCCVIGGKNTRPAITVEVSAVKLGKFFILCAYDRKNKVSRLQALTTEEACGSTKHIRVLQQWISHQCRLVTWKKINDDFLPGVVKLAADPSIGHVGSPGRHILNASQYLGKTMVQLFQNIAHHQLTIDTLQGVLNEVQWRERNGKTEESAFWSIMNEISRLNDRYVYTEPILGEISRDRFYQKSDISFRHSWGPLETGLKTSSTFNSDDMDDETEQTTSKSLIVTTKKLFSSSVSSVPLSSNLCAKEVESSKRLHPIRVFGTVPPSNIAKEKDVITAKELLSVKITFPGDENRDVKRHAYHLGQKLRKENFLFDPIGWFVRNQFIKDETSCYVCHGKAKLVSNPKYPDGVSWLCQKTHCMFDNRYKRPSFFAHFGFRMDVILATVFHWAVQSDYDTTVKSIPLNEFNIISIHRKLQQICAKVSERDSFKIGGKKSLVEVAFIRYGNCFILGAMERESFMSRFRAFAFDAKLPIDEIRKTLISWLHPGSTVIVNSNKYLGRYCMEERINLVFADKTATDIKSKKYHTLNLTNYFQRHVRNMFRTVNFQHMSAELLQVYLDELMWRERYRKSPYFSFQCIMRDIFAVEYGVSMFTPKSADSSIVEEAASYYGFSLPLPEVKISLQRLPEHLINTYTSPAIDTDEVTIIENVEPKKDIKIEIISSDDDEDEEIEVVNLTPIPEIGQSTSSTPLTSNPEISPSTSSAPLTPNPEIGPSTSSAPLTPNPEIGPSTSSAPCSQNDDTEPYFVSEKHPVACTSNSEFLVNKSEDNRRYSDKCYSRRKKETEDTSNGKMQCAECRDFVTVEHFMKPYKCSDCKYNVYSTYCQKAFARHRSYILFGRKIPESCSNAKKFLLPQEWYCLCGYSSLEGNELASHLIQCGKTTCYLNFVKPSSIL